MKSKRTVSFVLTALALLTTQCSLESPTPPPAPPQPTITEFPTATQLPTRTPKPTDPPDLSRLTFNCIETLQSVPQNLSLRGILAMDIWVNKVGSYLWNLKTGEMQMIGNSLTSTMAVSPDGSKLAYKDIDIAALLIIDSSGVRLKSIEDSDERFTPVQWLDEDLLVLNYRRREWDGPIIPDSIIIMNPFTGESQEFLPDYPNFNDLFKAIRWQGLLLSRMVVNPALTHLLYPALEYADRPLILWDLEMQREIVRIHNFSMWTGIASGAPRWMSDGTRFVTSAPLRYVVGDPQSSHPVQPLRFSTDDTDDAYININDDLPYLGGDELILVNLTGEINRLSYLTTSYVAREYSWEISPDGERIAFWLDLSLDDDPDHQLAVLEIETGEVTNYCLPGSSHLFWSPDSKKLTFNIYSEGANFSSIFLVDLEEGFAVRIAENAEVGGWMAAPP